MGTGQLLNLSDSSGVIGVGVLLDSEPQKWHVGVETWVGKWLVQLQ